MASNYIYSTRDLKFILKEWLDSARIMNFARYKDYYGLEDVDVILEQVNKIAQEKMAPTNDDGETNPARLENGKVSVPPSFRELYHFLNTEGWGLGNLDEHGEGNLPQILYSAVVEMITAANPAFVPYLNLTGGAAELIQSFGREKDKKTFLPRMFSGEWTGTMCLTEAGGGSDVGDILTKAYPTDQPGIYMVKGSKVFITAGDHDMTENIIHMTLARVEGAAPGTKGISLFIVPKIWVNEDGSLGEPNDVLTASLEHKMGLKGSSTAVLNFGENDGCRGILMGEGPDSNGVAQGMTQMFQMMNGARMDTGMAGYTLAAQAYFNAVEYARTRIQGRKNGKRVPIIQHADIRRLLLGLKAYTEAMRAMAFQTYFYFDISRHSPDLSERKKAEDRIEVNTPLVKAYCTDMAWPLIGDAIQVYGGYGYIEEYPVARLARDCKIYSLWEGTNYIQSMDLVGRKWNLRSGQVFQDWLDDIAGILQKHMKEGELYAEAKLMWQAMDAYINIKKVISEHAANNNTELLSLYATRILHATAQLYCGTLLLDQAIVAAAKIQEYGKDYYDYNFYQGKVDAARFYINNAVPDIFILEMMIKNPDTSALHIAEESLGS